MNNNIKFFLRWNVINPCTITFPAWLLQHCRPARHLLRSLVMFGHFGRNNVLSDWGFNVLDHTCDGLDPPDPSGQSFRHPDTLSQHELLLIRKS